MSWFKADDRLLGHWKFLGIDNDTLGTWFRCGVWAAQQVTDGFVPDVVLEAFTTPEVVDNLIRRGLWTAEDGGIRFHDWAEYQITKSEQDQNRQRERDRKRRQRRGSNGKYVAEDEVPDGWDEFVGPEETEVPHMSQWDKTGQADSPTGTERPSESVRRTRPDPTRPEPTRPEPVSPGGETSREPDGGPVDNSQPKRRRKHPETPIPDDWAPTDEHRKRAAARGVDVDHEADQFRAHAQAHDRRCVRWNAAFTQWIGNARPRPAPRGTTTPTATTFALPDDTDWQALADQIYTPTNTNCRGDDS